jgi:class 3 adenylate cyclase
VRKLTCSSDPPASSAGWMSCSTSLWPRSWRPPSSASPSGHGSVGDEREVSVLFADLAGFTDFSEERPASEVVEMLNRYWAAAVPAVVGEGGLIDRFAGDATIVVFNAVTDQPDHAMSQDRPGRNGPDDGPDATCGDAPGQHQADWCCLISTAG